MTERDITHLERIAVEINFIADSTMNVTADTFLKDDVLQRAVSMSLITIGECANHLSETFIKENSQIEWVQIIAVRNLAAHGYWQLDMRQIWQAVLKDIPELGRFITSKLEERK